MGLPSANSCQCRPECIVGSLTGPPGWGQCSGCALLPLVGAPATREGAWPPQSRPAQTAGSHLPQQRPLSVPQQRSLGRGLRLSVVRVTGLRAICPQASLCFQGRGPNGFSHWLVRRLLAGSPSPAPPVTYSH